MQLSVITPKVTILNGRAITTSQSVADFFHKQHKDVLKKIYSLDCSPEFSSANFCAYVKTVGIGNGAERESKYYLMTKDGFIFLVMGFTGRKAARFKEAYIAEFNRMEQQLRQQPKPPSLPDNTKQSDKRLPPGIHRIMRKEGGSDYYRAIIGYFGTLQEAVSARNQYLQYLQYPQRRDMLISNTAGTGHAHNIIQLKAHFMRCLDAWQNQISPALRSIRSPLAGELHDHFIHAAVYISYIEKDQNQR